MFIQNTLIDNSEKFMLSEYLREMLGKQEYHRLRIATGFWDLAGMKVLQNELQAYFERGGILDLLIGQEPQLRSYQMRPDLTKEEKFPDFYIQRDIAKLSEDYQPIVQMLLKYTNPDDDLQSQVRIRIYGQDGEEKRFLHAKCYIFTGYGVAHGIIGSSNFTEKGLRGNAELNYLETNPRIVDGGVDDYGKSHIAWFTEMWEQSVPWTGKFIKEILAPSPVGKKAKAEIESEAETEQKHDLTPYEVYIKYLQEQLGDIADPKSSEVLKSYLPAGYSSLSYQMDAVQQCFFIMKNHGGFILGDVVGLGKTVVGLLVIKRYLAEASTLGRERKVLIITPPAIKKAWEKTICDFDKDAVDKVGDCVRFITTGSLGKLIDEADAAAEAEVSEDFDGELGYDNYGLIIIDESHNFKNNQTQKYHDLDTLIGDIQLRTGKIPFIGLLSATPQNNSPVDLRNQIYLFQREPNKSTLPNVAGGKLDSFFSRMIKDFEASRKDSSTEGKRMLKYVASEIRERVLNDLVVRRTRTDIKKHYAEDSAQLKFPQVKEPHKLEYELDDELCELFFDTISAIVKDDYQPFDPSKNLGFYRYTAISYFVSPDNKRKYEGRNISADRVSKQLSNIMRILLVKRLESSFSAFKTSLHNLEHYTQNMIDMLENDTVFICPDVDVNHVIEKAGSLKKAIPQLEALIEKKGKNNLKFKRADFKDNYIDDLRQDLALIKSLCERWDKNDLDPKMDAFKLHFLTDLFDKRINNPHGYDKPRLVIFTEAIDTLESLVRYINSTGKHHALKISAHNRDEMHDAIVENFDANSKEQKDDYDVLVTTEVLAEGVNLHRSNVILNYDTPWNATRLMQRIGRVNRIGSKEDFVHVFNFYPTTQSNQQIRLIEIAYAKLQAFHTMFGEDNKIFSELEELSEADFNKLIDDEESPFGKYISDLKEFQKAHPDRYAFISEQPFESLGGIMRNTDAGKTVAVITATNRGLTNILAAGEEVTTISPLECMAELKCSEDDTFDSPETEVDEEVKQTILNCYQMHVTQMATARDASGTIRAANQFLHSLEPELTTPEAKKAWKAANRALRNNNTTVARRLLKFKEEREQQGDSLFGVNTDVSLWITSAFSVIAEKATVRYGDPVFALCEEKQ